MSTVSVESPKVQYSVQRELSDGSLNRISVRVPYFSKDDIHVYVDDIEIKTTAVEGSKYTWRWDGDYISITPNVDASSEVLVRRITPIDEAIHIFDGRSEFDDQSMDENFQQLIYIAQEYSEGSGIKDVFSDINMHGYKITNVGWATHDDDVVTYGQYKHDAEGAKVARDQAVEAASKAEAHEKNTKAIADKVQTDITASKESAIVEITNRVQPEIDKAKAHAITAQSAAGTAVSASNRSETILQHVQLLEDEAQIHANTSVQAKDESVAIKNELQGGLDNLTAISEPVKIVAKNIQHVVTDSQNIDKINIVGSDLEGILDSASFVDYGDLDTPDGGGNIAITGGNIKIVADNINAVRDNSLNIEHIKKVSTTIDTFPAMVAQIEQIKNDAVSAKDLSKDWATKLNATVDGVEYSAKHYANEAKKSADKTSADITAIEQAKTQAITAVNSSRDTAIQKVTEAGSTQMTLIESEGDTQILRVRDEGVAQTGAVEIKGTQEINRVQAEGDAQVKVVQASTPAEIQKVSAEGTKQVQAVTAEGTKQVNFAKAQVTIATQQATTATQQANAAKTHADLATAKATEADADALSASQSATQASASAKNSANSASSANTAAGTATAQAKLAQTASDNAALSKDAAKVSETNAKASEVEAKKQADLAKQHAESAIVGQEQADWNQTSTAAKSYIKNKPTLGTFASKSSLSFAELTGKPDLTVYSTKNELQTALAGKANVKHSHAISEITNLQSTLDGKALKSHTHAEADVTGLTAKLNSMNTTISNKLDASIFRGFIDYGNLDV